MFNFFLVLFLITLLVSLILYLPFLFLKKVSLQTFFKDFFIINLILNITYYLIFTFLIKFEKIPTNNIGWSNIIIPAFFILLIILLAKFLIKTNFQQKKIYLKKLFIPFVVWTIFFGTDYIRCKKNLKPIFCTSFNSMITAQDGGTTVYFGVGYQVFEFKTSELKCTYICPLFTDYNTAFDKASKKLID